MRILLVGGGSGGPTVPLLAVQSYIKERHPTAQFLFVGTASGPERTLVASHDPSITFTAVPAGKVRRYFSVRNLTAPFEVLAGLVKSLCVVARFKPDVVFSVGGYVSVPVGIAAWMLERKLAIHQQDVVVSMSNQILAPFASRITVSLASSAKDFSREAAVTGNPFRKEVLHELSRAQVLELRHSFGLTHDSLPLVLVTGGGTGALGLNKIVAAALPELAKFCCVIHVTGRGKLVAPASATYASRELIANMPAVLAAADAVVSRAGMATITELGILGKPSIVVPMPGSHQEANARALGDAHAAVVLDQRSLTPASFAAAVRNLLENVPLREQLSASFRAITPTGSTAAVAQVILSLCKR